jgi:hypothetical protein
MGRFQIMLMYMLAAVLALGLVIVVVFYVRSAVASH